MLFPVEKNLIPRVVPKVKKYIESCIEHSPIPITVELVIAALYREDGMKMFLQYQDSKLHGVIILNVYESLGIKLLNIFMMSHSSAYKEEDIDLSILEELARSMNISYITYYGRRGFIRKNAPKGFKVSQVVMTKEIV